MTRSSIAEPLAWVVLGSVVLLSGVFRSEQGGASPPQTTALDESFRYHRPLGQLSNRIADYIAPPLSPTLVAAPTVRVVPAGRPSEADPNHYLDEQYDYYAYKIRSGVLPQPVVKRVRPTAVPFEFADWDLSGYEGALPSRRYGKVVMLSAEPTPLAKTPLERYRPGAFGEDFLDDEASTATSAAVPSSPRCLAIWNTYRYEFFLPEQEPQSEHGLDLFGSQPSAFLKGADAEQLRTLAALRAMPSGARRASLNNYLESLGSLAIGFVENSEDTTGREILSLADDLPAAAALLATYRLLERGELGQDESVDLLRRTLGNLPARWQDDLQALLVPAPKSPSSQASQPYPTDGRSATGGHRLTGAMLHAALAPLYRARLILSGYGQYLPEVGWAVLGEAWGAHQSAQHPGPVALHR